MPVRSCGLGRLAGGSWLVRARAETSERPPGGEMHGRGRSPPTAHDANDIGDRTLDTCCSLLCEVNVERHPLLGMCWFAMVHYSNYSFDLIMPTWCLKPAKSTDFLSNVKLSSPT